MYFSQITLRPEIHSQALVEMIHQQPYGQHRLFWELFPHEQRRNFLVREEQIQPSVCYPAHYKGNTLYYMVSATPPQENGVFALQTKPYEPQLQPGARLSFRLRANPTLSRERKRHDVCMDAKRRCLQQLYQQQLGTEPQTVLTQGQYRQAILASADSSLVSALQQDLQACARYAQRADQLQQPAELLNWRLKSVAEQAAEDWLRRQGAKHGFQLLSTGAGLSIYGYRSLPLAEKGRKAAFSQVEFAGELQVTDPQCFVQQALFKGLGRAKAFGCGLLLVKPAPSQSL